ncbi:MAG: lamin tail domain-containing protein [Planctomycetia bacterium]|nr:lamin tail domain-containing protein [Planctomycetia bacterium]MCC7314789.1 lamin tail domain-containing protein [Planctomycetota bacterium]
MRLITTVATAMILLSAAATARAADVILNEYNAVGDTQFLANGSADTYWGTVLGNGGDWFELVVITDHLDMRGWTLTLNDSSLAGPQTLTLTNDNVWSDLRSGTIITVSEELGNNVDDYQPALGKWWLNVKAADDTNGSYITNSNFRVNNDNWQLTIRDSLNAVKFGPAGEGIAPPSGVGNNEVCKLEANPSAAITPLSAYNDGGSSSFGAPNLWNSGASVQSFSALRSVLPYSPLTSVRINEVLTHTDPPLEDYIELHNTTGSPIDISKWYLSDSLNDLTQYQIPDLTTIPANGYLVLYQTQFGFGLNSSQGDDVVLSQADGLGVMTGGRDYITFGPAENGVSIGRYPDGTGPLYAMVSRTPGEANSLPLVGPIVLNELMYHPPDLPGNIDNTDHEYVELRNITNAPLALSTFFPSPGVTHPWQLTGGISHVFSLAVSIAPKGYLLVVSFDPIAEPAKLVDFRATYGLADDVQVIGPYSGQLSNGGERVQLLKPDTPQSPPELFVPYILVDDVEYSDSGAWPTSPDGDGFSLERIDSTWVGNLSTNWEASGLVGGTPGCPNDQDSPLPADIDGDGLANLDDINALVAILLDQSVDSCRLERADVNADLAIDALDIAPFTADLLGP